MSGDESLDEEYFDAIDRLRRSEFSYLLDGTESDFFEIDGVTMSKAAVLDGLMKKKLRIRRKIPFVFQIERLD